MKSGQGNGQEISPKSMDPTEQMKTSVSEATLNNPEKIIEDILIEKERVSPNLLPPTQNGGNNFTEKVGESNIQK